MSAARSLAPACLAIAAALACLSGCAGPDAGAPADRPLAAFAVPKQLKAGQLIVTLADDTPEKWAALTRALASQYRLRETGSFPLTSIRVQCIVFEAPEDRPVGETLELLRSDPRVESVQPNQLFRGLEAGSLDRRASLVYAPRLIGASAAHRTSTGRGVKVAMIDTGVDTAHSDLRGRIVDMRNFVDGGDKTFTRDAHGTAVAGVIGARAEAGGVSGIAPGAEIVAIKACWYPEGADAKALCSSWTIAKALDFAIVTGARIINLSLGGPPDPLLARLIARAHARGATLVAATAEAGPGPGFPASSESVIPVVSADARGVVRTPGWNARIAAIAAPGVDILTTVPEGGYGFLTGTSFAAAHVTGVIALLLERKPDLAPAETSEIVRSTARPVAATAAGAPMVVGLVDACAALGRVMGRASCP